MRIISGRWKGRYLIAPKNLPVRPTTDMAKEALFNILSNRFDMDSLSVTDLFAGTGNISYEFASRGARSVRSVDMDRGCARYISETARTLGLDAIKVSNADVFRYLGRPQEMSDVIFADPPYDLPEEKYRVIVSSVFENGLLGEDGVLVIEHPKSIDLSDMDGYEDTRRYGTVHFSFFSASAPDED